MANDRADFAPEIRNAAWWATDTRQAANGRGSSAVLVKQGKMPPPDLSAVEAVQMGHVMQPVAGRLFEERTGFKVRDFDIIASAPGEDWLKAHTDFEVQDRDGRALLEAKNYNAAVRNKYSDPGEPVQIPLADRWQCIHEAICFKVDRVYLGVIFGGQEFVHYQVDVTDNDKAELVQRMARYWAHVRMGTLPDAEDAESAKLIHPVDDGTNIPANSAALAAYQSLKQVKAQLKQLEEQEDTLRGQLMSYMGHHAALVGIDGANLITWKAAKDAMKFDSKAFEAEYPDLYRKFVRATPTGRRFLVK